MCTSIGVQRLIEQSHDLAAMFTPIQSDIRYSRFAGFCSVALHSVFLLWLLHTPAPKIVAPSFVVNGDHGQYIAHLYWPNERNRSATDASVGTSPAESRQELNAHLTWKQRAKAKKATKHELPRARIGLDTETSTVGQPAQARAAGSPLGTVLDGPLSGEEIRPALPVVSPDPAIAAAELKGLQGDVVVEVTIDENGSIIQKVVIQSLAPAIDGKVLEALDNWRFRPATRNGVAIPSKQDVYYHFPRLGKG